MLYVSVCVCNYIYRYSLYATYSVQASYHHIVISHLSFLHLRQTGAAVPDARTLEASLEAASAAWCRFGVLWMKKQSMGWNFDEK